MANRDMKKVAFSIINPNSGAVFHEKIELTSGESDEIILPIKRIYGITGIMVDGVAGVFFTNDPPSVIKAAGANYVLWNQTSDINLAVTGFKVVWTSGTVDFRITVKTGKG